MNSSSSSSEVDSSDGSSDSSSETSQSDGSTDANHLTHEYPTDDPFIHSTLQWTLSVPIGLGLCPWAVKSYNQGRLRIVTCNGEEATDVATIIENEICSLTCDVEQSPPLSTTLVVCPHIKQWSKFELFEEFVQHGIKQFVPEEVLDNVTLVAFHPRFEKWYALPSNIDVGSTVQSHWGFFGQKSANTAQATIVEMENRAFGLRKAKVRFTDEIDGRQDPYVPLDWIDTSDDTTNKHRDPLPDNFMYQSQHPTIHIINNNDLAKLCVRDVSRVKRLNARRMARIGLEELKKRVSSHPSDNV